MFFSNLWGSNSSGNLSVAPASSSTYAKSGVAVDAKSALALSGLRRAVTLLAESTAQLPCHVYKRDGDQREKALEHPLYDLLRNQPNQKDSAFEYFETGQGFLGLNGNHIALIERDRKQNIKELIPIHRSKVQILKGKDGLPYYFLPDENETLPMRMVHHVKAFSMDGFQGLSPLQTSADSIGLASAVEEHASKVFSNGTTLSGVIERPKDAGTIKTQDGVNKVVSSFTEKHSGLRNMFSVAMLQEGMTYKQMAMSNEQAQLIEARKMGVADISRLYGVPLSMLSESAGESYKSIEQQSLNFVIYGLMPWLKRWESAMRRDLLLPAERKDYFIEFNVASLVRGDLQGRYTAYATARQWGWLSVNDIRRLENLPPIQGGDKYLTPLNMVDSKNIDTHQQMNTATSDQIKEIRTILER
ncbi:phage portal protein [Pseudoalteromonas piratica]|uniref:Portal protein n=1 Tax=Pseudoalteromonas piratica TaxID=1348114 RepID=A0A0A7EEV2_9GAMM|nr:phage portal protein [Pseudoalteromonas piratica]AIY65190.1 portal protein [Pseudoalteromonas piratica]